MLRPDEIKGELALELDADLVSAGDFLSCADAFVSLLREITSTVHNTKSADAWYVNVQEGSQVVNVIPNADRIPYGVSAEIIRVTVDGFRALEQAAEFPREFSDRAVGFARKLSRISTRGDNKRFPVRIIDKQRVTSIGRDIFNNSSALLDWKYEDLGTVEGALEAISVHGHYEFRIFEPIWSRSIKCLVDDDMLELAISMFRHRVEVNGLIRYTKDGLPTSVRVISIDELPDPSELPSYKDMKGILSDQSGGAG